MGHVLAGVTTRLVLATGLLGLAAVATGGRGGGLQAAASAPSTAPQSQPASAPDPTPNDVITALVGAGVRSCRDPGVKGADDSGAVDHGYWSYASHPGPVRGGGSGRYQCVPDANSDGSTQGVDIRTYSSPTAARAAADEFLRLGGAVVTKESIWLWGNLVIYEIDPRGSGTASRASHAVSQLPGITSLHQAGSSTPPAGTEPGQGTTAAPTPTPNTTPSPAPQVGTTSPAGVWMPTAPFYATFYYPWYQNPSVDGGFGHWQDEVTPGYFHHAPCALSQCPAQGNWNSHYLPDPNHTWSPTTNLYSSADVSNFYWQLSQMKAAHQTVAIASWWGQNDSFGTDANFRRIITDYMNRPDNPYPNMRWAVYYEMEGYGDPSVAQIDADLNYIKANYASRPGYLWVNGKPVIFVYNSYDGLAGYPDNDFYRWQQARADTGFYVNMKIQPVSQGGINPSLMDGWHEYGPASQSGTYGGLYYFISPGFWKEQETPRLSRNLTAFSRAAESMVAANVPWKLTETWNEWIEGTSVEPAIDANWTYDKSATVSKPNVATQNGSGYGAAYVNALGIAIVPPTMVGVEGGNRALYVRKSGANGFTYLGGVLTGAPAIAAVPQSSGPLVPLYVVTGGDHNLYVRSDNRGFQRLTNSPTYCLDNPAAVVTGPAGRSTLTVACQGGNHALYTIQGRVSAGSLPNLSGWRGLGGVLTAGPAVTPVGGTPTFFVTGQQGKVYTRTLTSTGFSLTPWTCSGHPAAATSGSTTTFACRGGGNALWYSVKAGSGWSAAKSGGGTVVDGPGVALSSRGAVFFVEAGDAAVWQNFLPNGGSLSGWQRLGGVARQGAGASGLG